MEESGSVLGSVDELTPGLLTEILRRQEPLARASVATVEVVKSFPTLLSLIAKLQISYDGAPPKARRAGSSSS